MKLGRQRPAAYEPLGPKGSRLPAVGASVALLLVVALVVLFAVRQLAGGGSNTHPIAYSTGSPMPSASGTASATSSADGSRPSATPAGEGSLQLDKARTSTSGVPTGYEHTLTGAVTAAYYFQSALNSSLNPDRVAVMAHAIADNSWATASSDLAGVALSVRTQLGLPATPNGNDGGAAAALNPAMFMVVNATPDDVDVVLLDNASIYNPSRPDLNKSFVVMGSTSLHWDGADWRMKYPRAISDSDRTRLTVSPLSSDSYAMGWRVIHA